MRGRDGEQSVIRERIDMVAGSGQKFTELLFEEWKPDCGNGGKAGTQDGRA